MALADNINKYKNDRSKLKKSAPSQAISPLTERLVNDNTNPDSLKMVGTDNAVQGANNQIAKDQEAVQNGAMAQDPVAQQQAQNQQVRQAGGQTLQDFQSQAIENAQEAVDQQAQKWSQDMAGFGSLGNRVATAVRQELAQENLKNKAQADFEVEQEEKRQLAEAIFKPEELEAGVPVLDQLIQDLMNGKVDEASALLVKNQALFKETDIVQIQATIFEKLSIPPAMQQSLITSALAQGVIDPGKMSMDYLIQQGILTTVDGKIPELDLTIEQLDTIFGADKWKSMTVSDIEDELYDDFEQKSRREAVKRELANPNIDPAYRQELARELATMDASGITEAEASVGRTIEKVGQADKIMMGDKLVPIEDVLSDENLKALADDLIMDLQESPEDAEEILAEWMENNPGYEQMGQWAKENLEGLGNLADTIKDSSDVIKVKTEKSKKFVEDNEIFGTDAKEILTALGFETEGFGVLGNDETNPTYQAFKKYATNNPDQWELFKQNAGTLSQEDLEGLAPEDIKGLSPEDIKGLSSEDLEGLAPEDILVNKIMSLLGTKQGWKKFRYLKDIDNTLKTLGDKAKPAELANVLFPEGSKMRLLMSEPDDAQQYLDEMIKLEKERANDPSLPDISEELKQFRELMDSNNDDKIDDQAMLTNTMKELMGDGFNIANFTGEEASKLWDLVDQSEVETESILAEAFENWRKTVYTPAQEKYTAAKTTVDTTEAEKPWVVGEPNVKNFVSNHPSRGKWKSAFDPGSLGPGEAQTAGAQMFAFFIKDPKNMDVLAKMINKGTGRATTKSSFVTASHMTVSDELVDWWYRNIGVPNPRGNWKGQIRAILSQLSKAEGVSKKCSVVTWTTTQKKTKAYNSAKVATKENPQTLKNPYE